MVELLSRMSEL